MIVNFSANISKEEIELEQEIFIKFYNLISPNKFNYLDYLKTIHKTQIFKNLEKHGVYIPEHSQQFSYNKYGFGVSKKWLSSFLYNKRKIIKRDNFRCIVCKEKYKDINSKSIVIVHHINGNRCDNTENNLVLLCKKCHVKKEIINKILLEQLIFKYKNKINTIRDDKILNKLKIKKGINMINKILT